MILSSLCAQLRRSIGSLLLASICSFSVLTVFVQASRASGVLRVHPSNKRYFTDDSGKAVLLSGDHTWNAMVENGKTDPPPAFNYTGFLNFLESNGVNFFRLFAWEQAKWSEGSTTAYYYFPSAYQRTGPGNALDGKLKFDLTKFNQSYFDRLRQRVMDAG